MTYAIFKAAGFQYRVEPGDVLRLPSLEAEAGDNLTFDEVLFGSSEGEVLVGRPTVKGAAVRAQVIRHGRADKIIIFKFKRRKNYRRKTGHRQDFTEILVSEIDLGGGRKAVAEPAEKRAAKTAPKKAPKAEATVAEPETPVKEKKPAKTKASTVTAAEKKAEAKSESKTEAKAAKPKTEAKAAKPKTRVKKKKS